MACQQRLVEWLHADGACWWWWACIRAALMCRLLTCLQGSSTCLQLRQILESGILALRLDHHDNLVPFCVCLPAQHAQLLSS